MTPAARPTPAPTAATPTRPAAGAAGRVAHINSATLIMGVTGSGKSSLLATLMRYVWENYHLTTLYYSSDGGGFPTDIQALVQKGICRIFKMRTRDTSDGSLSFETCQRSAQGWWPKSIDPATGETRPGEPMVPPVTDRYEMKCPNGHVVRIVAFPSLLLAAMCPVCKVHTTKENMTVVRTSHRTKGFETVGAVCYDGLSSMLSWMESDLGQRAGRLEIKGEEAALGGKVISGDLKFGGTTRSHVGFVQSRAQELVLNSLGIPNLVVPPTWTALTLETSDEGGLSVRGPKLSGRAKTDEGPTWFGNCFESMVNTNDKEERIFRLCLAEFTDTSGVRHLIKNRASPGALPPFLEDPPLKPGQESETAFQQFNLGLVYQLLEQARERAMAQIEQRYPDAPGLAEGIVEVGEAVTAGLPVGSAPTAPSAAPPAPRPAAPRAPAATTAAGAPAGAGTPASATIPSASPAPVAAAPAVTPPAAQTHSAPAPRPPVARPRPTPASAQAVAPTLQPAQAPLSDPVLDVLEGKVAPTPPPPTTPSATGTPQTGTRQWAAPGAPRPPAPAPRPNAPKPS